MLPEYLVEFDYITDQQMLSENKRLNDLTALNEECNKLASSINDTQRVLENTYIKYGSKDKASPKHVHLTTNDLERSDMGCLKKQLLQLMNQCHIRELMENNYEFQDDDTTQTAIENSMPPDIPIRTQLEEMNEAIIQSVSREPNLQNIYYLNLFNNKIRRIQGLDAMVNLKTLILSFNELENMDGLENCNNLVKLDLHNNFIRQISHVENKENLVFLDLTHNWISDWGMVDLVSTHCNSLKEFGMKCNPLATKKDYRSMMFSKLSHI